VAALVFASEGISVRICLIQLVNCGGSLATITGSVWPCWAAWAAWSLAATNIQWLTACSEIWLPATDATELLESELPQPAMTAAITKKAASAASFREIRIGRRW
jgi:hypothetical protein